ncbi:MAG: ribokinase [Chloroflexi bacterium]|nr:ribokinase [Chloroflexota bacterium]
MDFLAIGHVTLDRRNGTFTPGGTVTFAALTARKLGYRPAVLTRAGDDFPWEEALPGVTVHRLPSPVTTTFRNIYVNSHRIQYVDAVADPIPPDAVPEEWRHVPMVLLGAVAAELDPAMAALFPESLVAVVPQGLGRQWDETGRVYPRRWSHPQVAQPYTDLLVFSKEDFGGDPEIHRELIHTFPLVVVTLSEQGSIVYQHGVATPVPPRPAREVDPTGAGDVFTAAMLIRLYETGDPLQAAYFANVVASFAIEDVGPKGIPDRETVEAYLEEHPWSPIEVPVL